MTVYISGPITGKRNGNRKAFEKAAEKLEKEFENHEEGQFRIISPLEIADAVNQNFDEMRRIRVNFRKPEWADYMRACIKRLCDATNVFFIKGWQESKGALLERHIAEALGIPCAETIEELKASDEALFWR